MGVERMKLPTLFPKYGYFENWVMKPKPGQITRYPLPGPRPELPEPEVPNPKFG